MIPMKDAVNNIDTMKQEELIPKFPFRVLEWFCPPHLYEEIEGDLIQRFNRDVNLSSQELVKQNLRKAKYKLVWSVICFFQPGIILKNVNKFNLNWTPVNLFKTDFNFKKTNDLIGWSVFFLSLFVYSLTLEETASFWDCSEFIATSYKLQVPHPPGAPLFLLLGRFFSFFAFGDSTKVAYAINMMSALLSALTILFLYWSIVLVAKKLVVITKGSIEDKRWLIFIAGIVGSLSYAFSDSFWFSAVEAEVYAMSSLFTAFVVWAILKWETIKDEARANRWIILVAYVLGLSIGVHLLNLLTLPALALIYYFKKYKAPIWGTALAFVLGGISILFINDFIIPGLPAIAGKFELFFVNTLGLFFGSGVLVFVLLVLTALVYGVYYTQRIQAATANTFVLGLAFILIGYGTYATIVIRSNFDPPINENAPKDVMSFVRYLRREQYVKPPLLFGPYFTANPVGISYTGFKYVKGKDKYVPADRTFDWQYSPNEQTILPRAWYADDKEDYKQLMHLKEGQQPTFTQNMIYMFRHQLGTMYMRYFMWNFAGRENDQQGADWLKPDEWFKKLPSSLADNKARNNFFMIPFLLGLVGMWYQFTKDSKNFLVLSILFFMLGAAIVLYLNSPASEPRARDYIYVGSYYAFTFWIGLAVLGLAEVAQRIIQNKKMILAIASSVGILAPAILIYQGWDDHDRSNRFFSADTAHNSLVSCDKNGIVFTGGDNDTFPLWYEQEVENCRTDLRVLVLSYSNGDWYIDQTTRQAYQSPPFKYTLTPRDYRQGGLNNYLTYADFKIKSIDAKEYLTLLRKEHPSLQDAGHNLLPSRVITLQINKEEVLKKGVIPTGMENLVVDQMELKLKGNALEKSDLLFLDLLTTANWERPIYVNYTSMSQLNLDVSPYAVQEGNVYHILPVKNPRSDRDYLVDTDKTYDLMVNQFKYRGLNDPSVYYTEDYKMQVMSQRNNLNTLSQALLDKGKKEKAAKVLNFSLEKMPDAAIAYDPSIRDTVSLLFQVGQKQKAKDIATVVSKRYLEIASYLVAEQVGLTFELRKNLYLLNAMQQLLLENQEVALADQFGSEYERLIEHLQNEKEIGQ
jgi:hypothetical protein